MRDKRKILPSLVVNCLSILVNSMIAILAKVLGILKGIVAKIFSKWKQVRTDEEVILKFNNTTGVLLGQGGYGIVYHRIYQEKPVAVKRIELVHLKDDSERNAMSSLKHENILQLISTHKDDDFLYLVLELCHGTVEDYVLDKLKPEIKKLIPLEREALMQMANGLQYIHQRPLVHRDIKPANVLISTSSASGRAVLKISDFGFTRPVTQSLHFSGKSGVKGTPLYLAPEYRQLLSKSDEEREEIRPHVSIDIFSLGCLFFIYITKRHPFAEPKKRSENYILVNLENGIKNLKKNGLHASHYAYQIIDGMTQRKPVKRWTLNKVITALAPSHQPSGHT